ncbi:aminoglycoside phosphotransferase family protein [Actinopolymorpha pittospori]
MRETERASGGMPTMRMLDWAAAAIGAGARIAHVQALHDDQGPWRLTLHHRGRLTDAVLRAPTPRIDAAMVATGAAALEVAERCLLPAPRLMDADLQGVLAGVPVTLETVVPGTTAWPPPPSAKRLRAAGAALARVHAVAMAPREDLPFRPRPIAVDDFAADRRASRMPTTPLLSEADDLITAYGLPSGEPVYLHGDVWPGNLLWAGNDIAALIDWKTAGVGAPGVDLCELRKQVAITFGPQAPDHVLHGWERATGTRARDVAYWDAVAALNTPTELDGDGDGTPTARRDAFLRAALSQLG